MTLEALIGAPKPVKPIGATGFETLSVEEFDKILAGAEVLFEQFERFGMDHVYVQAIQEARRRLREPMQPGWTCSACGAFCGESKERKSACRCCGLARQT